MSACVDDMWPKKNTKMAAALFRSFRRWTYRRSFLFFLVLSLVSGCSLLYVRLGDSSFARTVRFRLESALVGVTYQSDGFQLDTPGCLLPTFDPWMDKTRHFFWKLSSSEPCPRRPEDVLVSVVDGRLKIDQWSKAQLERKGARSGRWRKKWRKRGVKRRLLTCRKWTVHRRAVEENDRTFRIKKNFTEFDNETAMDSEFAQVECSVNGGRPLYRDYFYSVPEKPEVERACASNEALFLSDCSPPTCLCRRLSTEEPRLSVLVVGVDSVSKANFLRQFPRSHRLLAGSAFAALDFAGYNKVGLNTFPCLMPYLTGQSASELAGGCWGHGFFDNCSTLWDDFAAAGYRTAFVENLARYGLFTYNKRGFRRQPVHYYGRTLYMPVIDHVHNFRSSGCWRGAADDEHVLRWALLFQTTFDRKMHFGHFWVSRFTHDNVNGAQRLDPLLSEHLLALRPLLNSTLLMLISDHGIRFGDYRQTDVGRHEENLPFMYMVFPRWFREKHPRAMQNLEVNRHRLVTTYDLHATLSAIVNCDYGEDNDGGDASPPLRQRAISLFRQVSPERTCEEAAIPAPYCACRRGEDLRRDPASSASAALALKVVGALNEATSSRRAQCEFLRLERVVSVTRTATSGAPRAADADEDGSFVVALRAMPGSASFEANVDMVRGVGHVHPDVRRVNRYGHDSWCIDDDHFLKSVCICKGRRSSP